MKSLIIFTFKKILGRFLYFLYKIWTDDTPYKCVLNKFAPPALYYSASIEAPVTPKSFPCMHK